MTPNIPDEMRRNGRPVRRKFDDNETLYRRVRPESFSKQLYGGNRLPIYAVELPDCSVNRSEPFGKPEFVLYDTNRQTYRKGWGVVSFSVRDVPPSIVSDEDEVYRSDVFHKPEELNYYHSEIRMFNSKNEHLGDEHVIPPSVQNDWRNFIRCRMQVVVEPPDTF